MHILITNYFILPLILTKAKKPPVPGPRASQSYFTRQGLFTFLIRYHYMHRTIPSQIWIGAYLTKPIITILKIGKKFFTLNLWFEKFSGKKILILLIGNIKMKFLWLAKNNFKKYIFLNRNYKNEIFLGDKKQL